LLACLTLAAGLAGPACGGGASDGPGVVAGKPSDVDGELPVPEAAVKQEPAGAWRVSQPPDQVFAYYQDALPKNGWTTERDSSRLSGPTYVLTVCRQRMWRTIGINPDRNQPGDTLLTVGLLPGDQTDRCP
jgi:hypothetical protein